MFRQVKCKIIIGAVKMSLEQFQQLEPDYAGLPEGMIERNYNPSNQDNPHILFDGISQFDGGDWPEGDVYLSKEADYEEALKPPALPVESVAEIKARLKDELDIEAGKARSRLAARGDFISVEYDLALAEAKAWMDAGKPLAGIPETLVDEVAATGQTPEQVASLILDMDMNAKTAIRAIRKARRAAWELMKVANEQSEVQATFDGAVAMLRQIP